MNDEALLRITTVEARTGYGRSSIYRLIKAGLFPAQVRLAGGGAAAWRASDISRWIEAQTSQSGKVAA